MIRLAVALVALVAVSAPLAGAQTEPAASPVPTASPEPAASSGPASPDIKESGTDVPPPKRTKMTPPTYPPEAQAQGIRGIVIVEIVIDTQGKVSSAQLVRSIPGLDEAALGAVRTWEYEVTRVDGKPVPVRLRVPITFALRLPNVDRQEGVPELRAGVLPALPEGAASAGEVKAQITVDPDGRVSDASVTEGQPALAEAVVRALNTWRFAPDPEGATIECRLVAHFDPGAKENKVSIRLESPQKSQTVAQAAAAPAPAPAPSSAPTPSPTGAPAQAPSGRPTPVPSGEPAPAPSTTTTPATPAASPPPTPAAVPTPVPSSAPPTPVAPSPAPSVAAETPSAPASPPATTRADQPPIEVISQSPQASVPAAAPPAPPEQGFSSIRDVSLSAGVPDLVKGRRPVLPPVARIEGATGNVRVDFTIDAAGQTSVLRTEGTEQLKTAAQQAVQSWSFRRTRPERVAMTAEFVYTADGATASVKPTP